MRERINAAHMANGVTLLDPATTYIDVGVRIGADTRSIRPIDVPGGRHAIGRQRRAIGPSTRIVDSTVGDGAEVDVRRRRGGSPSARDVRRSVRSPGSRPGTVLADDVIKAGSFVEMKNADGRHAARRCRTCPTSGTPRSASDVNVGAGNVTANYDGYDKHRTVIGDEVRHRLGYHAGCAGHDRRRAR